PHPPPASPLFPYTTLFRSGLALESADGFFRHCATSIPGEGGPDELDGGRPGQHAMPGPPDLSHPAFAELLFQAVAPQLARALDLDRKSTRLNSSHLVISYA